MPGAADLVESLFASAATNATALATAAETAINDAITAATELEPAAIEDPIAYSLPLTDATLEDPTVTAIPAAPTLDPLAVESTALDVPEPDAFSYRDDLTVQMAAVTAEVGSKLGTFFSTYFPLAVDNEEITLAQDWTIRVLSDGGAMDAAIENQYWQRDRDRIAREAAVKADEVTGMWASRGFPLPPGAATGAVLAIQRTAQEQASESSRGIAIKKFEIEVTLQQKAVELAIALRRNAIDAMIEYIRTVVLAPYKQGFDSTTAIDEATARANGALFSYYSTTSDVQTKFEELTLKAAEINNANDLQQYNTLLTATISHAELEVKNAQERINAYMRQRDANAQLSLGVLSEKIKAAIAKAQMAATQASASFNGITASASVSGNDSTQFYG